MILLPSESIRFDYTGKSQSVTLGSGKYLIQCYGAKGANGSNGGYAQGYIRLKKDTTLYAYCGESPTDYTGGWNGGSDCSSVDGGGGGGRSDVALGGDIDSDDWSSINHLQKIILSAQGGNGGNYVVQGGTLKTGSASYSSRDGVLVFTWYPSYDTSCRFYSTSYTKDPYGHVYENGKKIHSNDDGGGNLNFSITFNAVAGRRYQFYVGAYSSSGSATYVISSTVIYGNGGTGAVGNYYYTPDTTLNYPYGDCDLENTDIYIENESFSANTGSNTHGYIVITRVPIDITYIGCTGSLSQVHGKEVVELSADKTKEINSYAEGFVMYVIDISPPLYLHLRDSEFIVPEDIWYDFTVEAIYARNLRYNSNFYKNANLYYTFDFEKIVGDVL